MPTNNPQETGDALVETSPETTVPVETPGGDAKPSLVGRLRETMRARKASREATEAERLEQERLVRLREQQETQRQHDMASQAAVSRRRASRAGAGTETADEIAPVPSWMKIIGAWFDRSFGSTPLVAPLVVSGFFTMDVGMDAPLNMNWLVALAFTLGLEGSLWYLSRLYEQTRLEGDSTFSLRVGMIGIILLIAGLIGGHAVWKAMGSQPILIDLLFTKRQLPLEEAVPALAVALMSAIGTFVWSKRATFRHRVRLRQQGLIDTRAPKFSTWSWILDGPATFLALRHAVKYRITSPSLAMEDRRLWVVSNKPKVWPPVETVLAEVVSETAPALTPSPVSQETRRPAVSSRPSGPALPAVSAETVSETQSETPAALDPSPVSVGDDQVETVGRLHRDGNLSYAKIADRLGISKAHAGRLGSEFYKRHAGDEETTETAVAV